MSGPKSLPTHQISTSFGLFEVQGVMGGEISGEYMSIFISFVVDH
jgi:hypothetical protein